MGDAVALLRGINVGGRKKVPMGELRAALEAGGFADVRTYLQSGNVVLAAADDAPPAVEAAIERLIAGAFDLDVTVIVRSGEDLRDVLARNPLPEAEAEPAKLHVAFLRAQPSASKQGAIDPDRSPADRFALSGREVYLHYPDGAGRSKLTLDYLERVLGVPGTVRNWNTVRKLADLAASG